MPWGILKDRYDDLPIILAGPILRHVDAGAVSVWVAVKQQGTSTTVTLEVYDPSDMINTQVFASANKDPLNVGSGNNKLSICVVTAHPTIGSFEPGKVYRYNVKINGQGFETSGILNNSTYTCNISYDTQSIYPSFSLPAVDPNDLRVVHGSCRKPHGGMKDSVYDALWGVDRMIDEAHDTAAGSLSEFARQRPHLLFLTGDQVYADDVSDIMLHMLRDAIGESGETNTENMLLGWTETLPGLGEISNLSGVNADIFYPGQRIRLQQSMKDENGIDIGFPLTNLTTTTHTSHLMKLGEYLGMYLFAWSDVLWPNGSNDAEWHGFPPKNIVYGNINSYSDAKKKLILKDKKYHEQIKSLAGFRDTLPKVRRLLANVPTYMICDDHEITDDWNLNKRWAETVVYDGTKPLGRRIVQNGMSAYLLCQAWGNDPAYFKTTQSALLTKLTQLNDPDQVGKFNDVGALILPAIANGTNGETYLASAVKWDYTLRYPHNNYQFLVLNTRTNRLFPAGNERDFVGLLSHDALTAQFQEVAGNNILTYVISPAPVFGSAPIDRLSQLMIKISDKNIEKNDAEFWNFNKKYFELFLEKLSSFSYALLLGGDVHFGLTRHVTYWNKRTGTPTVSQFASLVSSACKNDGIMTRNVNILDRSGLLPTFTDKAVSGLLHIDPSFVRIIPPSYIEDVIGWDSPGFHLQKTNNNKDVYVLGTPAIFNNLQDPNHTAIWTQYHIKVQADPHWYYRIRPVQDPRNDAERTIDAAAVGAYPGLPGTFPFSVVRKLRKKMDWSRNNMIVGTHHVAEIRLTWNATQKIVNQKFWFMPTGVVNDVEKMHNYTTHTVDFNLTEPTQPGQY